jgi:hypothetical protein
MVALWGSSGPAHIRRRQEGCLDALKLFPNVKLLDSQYVEHGIDDAIKLTENFLTAYGAQIDAIYAAGSVLAEGASRALEGAGYKPGEIPLVGIDMTEQSIKLMNQGWFQGIQPAQPVRLAYLATKYGVALAVNVRRARVLLLHAVLLTTDNDMITLLSSTPSRRPCGASGGRLSVAMQDGPFLAPGDAVQPAKCYSLVLPDDSQGQARTQARFVVLVPSRSRSQSSKDRSA